MAHDHDHDHQGHDHSHSHDHGEGPTLTAVVEEIGPCKKLLKVEVCSEEVKKEVNERLKHLGRTVHLKGFRPGKAPRKRIEKIYGKAVRDDARDHLLRQTYTRAIEQEVGEAQLLGEGTIENVSFSVDEGLRYEVTIHTRPEFELGEYKGITVDIEKVQVEEEEVERGLEQFRASRGEVKPVTGEGAVVEGEDQVTVDVEVWLADEYEAFAQANEEGGEATVKALKTEEGIAVQLPLDRLGNYMVQDLADSLTGLKIGEWGEVESDLPVDYEIVEGRGEPAMLRTQVKTIMRLFLPELTEEWVKSAGHDSMADLRREVREELQQRLEHLRRGAVEERILVTLREQVGEFGLPAEMLEKEIAQASRRRQFELQYMEKLEPQDAEAKVNEEAAELAADVETALRSFFVLDEIAKREEIEVTEGDVQTRIAILAAQRGQDPEAMRAQLEQQRVLPQLYHDILDEKTRTFLRENATVNEVEDED
jgi:trigger factor